MLATAPGNVWAVRMIYGQEVLGSAQAAHAAARNRGSERQPRGTVDREMAPAEMAGLDRGDGRAIMKRTDVTYGRLDKVLRALGFACRLVTEAPPTRVYEHKESGAWIMLPVLPEADRVRDYHLASVRATLEGFGIADAKVLDAKLQKAG
jgi:hypothetical protein